MATMRGSHPDLDFSKFGRAAQPRGKKQVGYRVIVVAEAVSLLLLRVQEIGGELPAQFFLACHLAEHHLGD
jgi:hypothetical protein